MKIDWNAFKTKNENYRNAFEQLCYILFCREHNIHTGIFRYKNQVGIETEPILINKELIGWQAKFFEHRIDKAQITESIKKAKEKNPKLEKIFLYINVEFSETTKKGKKKSKLQTEIESFAIAEGIEVIWRVPSHIELQLTKDENKYLTEVYFTLGKTTYDSIEELFLHTQALLDQIQTEIDFNNNKIKLENTKTVDNLVNILNKPSISILSGIGGIGKTAIIKDLYLKIKDKIPFFVFKATEFNISHITDLLKRYGNNFSLNDLIGFFGNIQRKLIVIDSAEKISDLDNQDVIKEFVSILIKNNWSIIFTTRLEYYDDLTFTITELWAKIFIKINIDKITLEELTNLSNRYNFNLPSNDKLLHLVEIPFYLNEYLQIYTEIEDKDIIEEDFRNLLWQKKILGINIPNSRKIKREKCFIELAIQRANNLNHVINDIKCEEQVLRNLEEDGIIRFDKQQGGYFITHDIYEEWALEKYINSTFTGFKIEGFFKSLGNSLAIRRAFRKWLSENIKQDVNKVSSIIDSLNTGLLPQHWKDEIIVSIQLSPYSENFFNEWKSKLLRDNDLLERIIFLTRVACKEIDNSLFENLGINSIESLQINYQMTQPKGEGWKALIKFVYENEKKIRLNQILIIELLNDWISKNKTGETTRFCGLLGIYFLKKLYEKTPNNDYYYYVDSKIEKKLSKIILNSANEISGKLQELYDEVLINKNNVRRYKYENLVHITLTSLLDNHEVIKALPLKVLELANKFWFDIPKKDDIYRGSLSSELEESFCINSSTKYEYLPASAFQTPIYFLLKVNAIKTLKFIVDFINKTIECYVNSKFSKEIETIDINIDGEVFNQYISNRIWPMYRGTGQPSSYLLQSIHMALEKWLLEIAKKLDSKEIERICINLIKNSKSASISSIITSVVLANSRKLRNIALILFKTKELFFYDTSRVQSEYSARSLYSIGKGLRNDPIKDVLINERMETCKDDHRKISLENLMLTLQVFKEDSDDKFEEYRDEIWEILDNYYSKLSQDDDKTWRLYLARMDYRKQKVETKKHDKGILMEFQPQIDDELKKYSEESISKSSELLKHTSLRLWSEFRFKNEKSNFSKDDYKKYEDNPLLALEGIKDIQDEFKINKTREFSLFNGTIPIYVSTVLIRDFFEKLDKGQREFCKKIIFEHAIYLLSDNYFHQFNDGAEATISILPVILQKYQVVQEEVKLLIVRFYFAVIMKLKNY